MGDHWLKCTLLMAVGCSAPANQETAPAEAVSVLSTPTDWEAVGFARERGISQFEARQRLGWQALGPALHERAAAELGDDFGGVWIEPGDGDRVKVGIARGEAAPAALRAARAVGLNDGVDHVTVRYSMAELAEAKAWIAVELHRVNEGATKTLKVSVRTDLNAVSLSLPSDGALTPEQRELVQAAQARYGDRVALHTFSGRMTPNACVYPNCDAPLRGGVRTQTAVLGGGFAGCTGAFIARSKVDAKLYQFTAGHCFLELPLTFGSTSGFLSDGTQKTIGPMHNAYWGSLGDAAIVEISDPASWNPQNRVFVTAGPGFDGVTGTNTDSIYGITATGWSVIGQRICISGAMFGSSNCGRVTDLDVSYTTSDAQHIHVDGAGEASYCAVQGDSGAPLFASHTAFGIHSGTFSKCDCGFSGIRGAEGHLNVTVLTAPN